MSMIYLCFCWPENVDWYGQNQLFNQAVSVRAHDPRSLSTAELSAVDDENDAWKWLARMEFMMERRAETLLS